MKICTICQKTYSDENLNFCLDDGGTLTQINDNPPPTMLMNTTRQTNPNWPDQTNPKNQPFGVKDFSNDPFSQQTHGNPAWSPPPAPIQGWQNQGLGSNTPFQPPMAGFGTGQDQTLPIISLVLGILGFVLMCCYGGLPLGVAAMITGYLGMTNTTNNPMQYGGRGLAIAGMVIGGVEVGINLLWVIIFVLSSVVK